MYYGKKEGNVVIEMSTSFFQLLPLKTLQILTESLKELSQNIDLTNINWTFFSK